MTHERAARSEHVVIEAAVCVGESGEARPGMVFTFSNHLGDRTARAEFCCEYDALLEFVLSVERMANRATLLAMEANERWRADAN